MTSDANIENEIQAKALLAPRVTLADMKANIVHTEFVRLITHGGQVLRWAVLTTRSGFAVTGRPSVSVSPENDDTELGEKIAMDNAVNELWPLMGYALKDRLNGGPSAPPPARRYDEVRAAAVKSGITDPATLHALAIMPFTNDLHGILLKTI